MFGSGILNTGRDVTSKVEASSFRGAPLRAVPHSRCAFPRFCRGIALSPPALQKESSAEIKKDIASAQALIEEAYKNDVRGIVKQLHPAAIRFGLLPGLRSLVETVGGPFEARLVYDEQDKDLQSLLTDGLSENVRLGIYRVVEESLNNIAKHSRATHVTATLTVAPGQYMVVAIKDNGEGFDEKMVPPGYGLVAMEDHCTSLGGEFAVRSAPGQGTLIRASFPIARPISECGGLVGEGTTEWLCAFCQGRSSSCL